MSDGCFSFAPKFRPASGPPTCKMNWQPLENALLAGGGAGTGVAASHDQNARVEAARKIITNRQAVLNDICNPVRKSESKIIEVVPAHLSVDVENGMRETARRLIGNVAMMPIPRPPREGGEAWVSMAKVMDARLQTSRDQCPGRAADMSAAAGKALREVLKEVCGEQFPSRIAPESSGMMPKPTNVGPPTCKSDWSALERLLNNGGGATTGAASKYSSGARVEAARKLIMNRAAVLNDICNPERKTMHNIHEVVPAHLAGIVESGMKETARRLLGGSGKGDFRPSSPVEKEAAAGMAKVISNRLQTSANQCPNRAPDMGEEAGNALVDVLKEVSGASFQRKVEPGHTPACSIM